MRSRTSKRLAVVAAAAAVAIPAAAVTMPVAASAHHNAYMVVSSWENHALGVNACAQAALRIRVNPWDDWEDPSCTVSGSRIYLIAKHVG